MSAQQEGEARSRAERRVFSFGDGKADGDAQMKELLGGKGANLAEMTRLGLPVPPGFTISTEVVRGVSRPPAASMPKSLEPEVASGAGEGRADRWARASATPSGRCSSRCARARAPRCRA